MTKCVFRKNGLSLALVCQQICKEFRPLVFKNRTFDQIPFDYLQGTTTLILRPERNSCLTSALTLLCQTIERKGVRVYLDHVHEGLLKVLNTASNAMETVFPGLKVGPSTPVIAFDPKKTRVQ
jgi:hypothetical protein